MAWMTRCGGGNTEHEIDAGKHLPHDWSMPEVRVPSRYRCTRS